jgi:hypothetical protein
MEVSLIREELPHYQHPPRAKNTDKATEPEQRWMPDIPVDSAPYQKFVQCGVQQETEQEYRHKAWRQRIEQRNFTRHGVMLL